MGGRHDAVANLKSFQDSASATSKTLEFGSSIVRLVATNDSGATDLNVKIAQDWVRIKPKETLTLPVRIKQVEVSAAASTVYRIWGFW
jgi:hypothetical protein